MTNGLVKDRLTYFHSNGTVYQSFNTSLDGIAKILAYVNIRPNYVCCREILIDHPILSVDELKLYADELEENWPSKKTISSGKWIKVNNPNYSPFDGSSEYKYFCPACRQEFEKSSNFCPNCGADMRG